MRESVRPGTDGGDFIIVEKAAVFSRLKAPYASARDEIASSIAAQGPMLERIITANTAYAAARESDGSFLQRQEMLQRINKGTSAYTAVRSLLLWFD